MTRNLHLDVNATLPTAPARSAPDRPAPAAPVDTRPARWPASIMRRRVLAAAGSLRSGRLDVTMPDGSVHGFGPVDHPRRASVRIRSERLWARLLRRPRLAPGETFVDGLWDSDDPALVLEVLARETELRRRERGGRPYRWARLRPHRPRRNDPRRARAYIHRHYDLGNDLFTAFLDPTITYSCAVFERPDQSLEQAQVAKYERICRKLQLRPGMRVLEIGCGWGGFALHAATHHGVHVTGVTISEQQYELARERVADAGLQDRIEIRLADYRTLDGRWDRIASIEMFEAIGEREFDNYFATVDRLLARDGIACVQTIALPDQRWDGYRRTRDWIQQYIFPGGLLPSIEAISRSMRRSSELMLHDLEEIGIHYARTLELWRERFLARRHDLADAGYDERFQRVWEYYLSFCEAGFRSRILRDVQLVLTRPGTDDLAPIRPA
ncbi:MAG: class I SAM-dependent methyltransferase [Thermoleophilia bacterium]|nr:class I SAM-dependent methyltransferase [Thermoleophilia bacterium]